MVIAYYAALHVKRGWKVNVNDPGFCVTNLNGYRWWNTTVSGVVHAVRLATLGEDGPTGLLVVLKGLSSGSMDEDNQLS